MSDGNMDLHNKTCRFKLYINSSNHLQVIELPVGRRIITFSDYAYEREPWMSNWPCKWIYMPSGVEAF